MTQTYRHNRLRLLAGVLALSGIPAFAQSPAAPTSEDTVTLSPFQVTSESDRGYVSAESMTGSRVATKIIDLPYTVNVVTAEFFADFGLFELGDNLVQIGSFTGLDVGGGFTLRGFGSSSQLRDGFYRLGRYGSSNVDRMEIIKGSNAAIYGRTSPGGMVNMISKMPKDRESYKLSLNFGDYGTQRVTLEANTPTFTSSLGKTSVLITASEYKRDFNQEYAENHNHEYYLAMKHTFDDSSSLTLQAEYFLQERNSPNSAAPLVIDAKGTTTANDDVAIGYAKALSEINAFGPNSELNRGNVSFSGTYEKRFNQVWSLRTAGNYYKARRWDFNQNTSWGTVTINQASGAAPTTARGATPNRTLIFEDGGGFQADLLAHYWLKNRSIENRTLMTIDINDYYRWDPTKTYGPATSPFITAWNAVRTVTLDRDTLRPVGDVRYFGDFYKKGMAGEGTTRDMKRRTTAIGGLVRHQSALFDSRLLAYAGARFDRVRFRHRDFLTAPTNFPAIPNYVRGQMIDRTVNELKPNVGLNYKVNERFRVFANYSESYFVNQGDNPNIIAAANYKSEIADGYDYGFKGSYFEDRLTFTVSGFYANRNNVRVSEIVEFPEGSGNYITENRPDGDQLVRGWEADINWNVNQAISLGGSYGNVNSIYTDFGSANPLAVGRKVNGVSPQNGSIYLKWSPGEGRLKGFSANIGVTYVDETPTETPNAGDTYATVNGARVLTRTTNQWALTVPSSTLLNVGARYTYRAGSNLSHTVAVNLNNVTDRDSLKTNRQAGERRAVYVTYTLGYTGTRR